MRSLLRSHRGVLIALAAFAVFTAIAAVMTFPFVLRPASTLVAPIGFDVSSSVGKFAAIAREGVTPFESGHLRSIAAPEGIPLTPGLDAASFSSATLLWVGALTIGSIPSHGLMSLLGMVLSAGAMFLFVRSITKSTIAGFVSALACGFYPHMRMMAIAAQTYTHAWLYILPLWALTALARAPSRRRALLAGGSALPAMFWTPYFTLHVLVAMLAGGAVVGTLLWRAHGGRNAGRLAAIAALPVIVGAAAYGLVGIVTSFGDVPERDASDLYTQAAHPLMYVIPGQGAWAWGENPYSTLVDIVPRASETNLYLGLVLLALGCVAGVWLVRTLAAGLPRRGSRAIDPMFAATAVAAAVLVAALAWSLPPTVTIAGLDIPTPAAITGELAPALRAGQRFVMLAMPALAVLGGVGAALTLRRVSAGWRPIAAILMAGAVFVDLAVALPGSITNIPRSPALAVLASQPTQLTAHLQDPSPYGLVSGPVARPCVLQTQHEQPLINACNLTTDPAVLGTLSNLGDGTSCEAIDGLRQLGVRYLILDSWLHVEQCPAVNARTAIAEDAYFRVFRLAGADEQVGLGATATRALVASPGDDPPPPSSAGRRGPSDSGSHHSVARVVSLGR